jgi:hypothetical protein
MDRKKLVAFAAAALMVLGWSGTASAQTASPTATASAGSSAAASPLPQGSEPVKLDPADFTTRIDNPYWPMAPGDKWVYSEIEPGEPELRVEVTVTDRTKQIANGVEARIVHDIVSQDGQPIEITDDWYAQDKAGNIWYLGEDTAEYEDGKIKTRSGSFEAGVDGAQPGIVMPANPRDGMAYRQEYYEGEAEDRAEVLSTDEQVEVPFGHFEGALMTKDLVPLEPKVSEYKLYARDVGPVLTLKTSGGSGSEELVSYSRSGKADATASNTAGGSASALAKTGGAFSLTALALLALLAVLVGTGVLAFRVVRSE